MAQEIRSKNRPDLKHGDTRGWKEKTGTGYKWEVKNGKGKWVRYRNHKRQISNTLTLTGNVDIPGRIKDAPRRWERRITAPFRWVNKKAKESKERRKKEGIGEFVDKEKLKIKKETLNRAKENLNKTNESSSKTSSKTSSSSSPKKRVRRTGREALRAKNVERFGQKHVDHLRAKHADFKKMKRKEMSKADFIKKYPKSQTAKRSRR